MNRYVEIQIQWERLEKEYRQLEEEYKGKPKGNIYQKRKIDILNKKDGLKHKALSIGTLGTICKVSGRRSRPSLKNPQVMVNERFNLFFVNVAEDEVSYLIGLHVKNVSQYKVEFYKPGKILITE
jgi:hypothetical protein